MEQGKRMSDILPVGSKVRFTSGNFIGLDGVVKHVDNDSKDPRAIYGVLITIELSNGKTGFIEKSEHFHKLY